MLEAPLNCNMSLKEYFKEVYSKIQSNLDVEESLAFFGVGKSNEGTDESNGILRYYVKPFDNKFHEIFLNFNKERVIESIVWFIRHEERNTLSLEDLKELFGSYICKNVIYDDTTEIIFNPHRNTFVPFVRTTIYEWVETRNDGTLFYKKDNKIIDINKDYSLNVIVFIMK